MRYGQSVQANFGDGWVTVRVGRFIGSFEGCGSEQGQYSCVIVGVDGAVARDGLSVGVSVGESRFLFTTTGRGRAYGAFIGRECLGEGFRMARHFPWAG